MTTAVLIPFAAWGLVEWTQPAQARAPPHGVVDRRGPAWCCRSCVRAWPLMPLTSAPERTEQRTAGEWIAENTPRTPAS